MAVSTSLWRGRWQRFEDAVRRPGPLPLALAAGFVGAVAFRIWLTTTTVTPWIMVDELLFSQQARSIAQHGNFDVRGQHYGIVSLLYPVLIAPGWLLASGKEAYGIAKATNAALVTLGAVPLYLWARRLLPSLESVLVCVLGLSIPPLLLAGNLMSDNAFFPAFLLAAFAMALALERPTLLRQGLALAGVALACAVRLQGFVLLLVLPTAILLYALLQPRAAGNRRLLAPIISSLRPLLPSLLALPLAVLVYMGIVVGGGAHWSSGLGAYRVTAEAGYSISRAARWIVYHFAELDLASGFVAIPALFLLLVWAFRQRSSCSRAERAFVAVTVSSLLWFILQAGVFASRFSGRIEERLMFYVTPLLMLALVLWLSRRGETSRLPKLLAFTLPAVLVLILPLGRLLVPSIYSDTFGLIPFSALLGSFSVTGVKWFITGLLVLAGALFVLLPRAVAQVVLPVGMAVFLAVSSVSAARHMRDQSRAELAASGTEGHEEWIDAAVGRGARVGFLLTSGINPHSLWQLEFWNASLGPVYALGRGETGGLPHLAASLDPTSGTIRRGPGVPVKYLVGAAQTEPVGELLSRAGDWTLYRVRRPLRLASDTKGVASDGWMGNHASDTVYATSHSGTSPMTVTVSRASWSGPDRPSPVRIVARSLKGAVLARRAWIVHRLTTKTFHLGVLKEPYRVSVLVKNTFSPADFGLPDQRQLGAQIAFHRGP